MIRMSLLTFVLFISIAASAPSANAVFKVETPVSKLFNTSASVIVGKVTKVNAETGVVEASATTLKGEGVGETLKFKLDKFPDILRSTREGSSCVLLLGQRSASNVLHLADSWLFPTSGAKASFVISSDLESRFKQTFPGTTAALVAIIEDVKAKGGKSSMIDEVSPDMFKGGVKQLGSIPAGGTALASIKPAGSKTQTIVLTTPAGPKFFSADATGLKPAQPVTEEHAQTSVPTTVATVTGNFGEEPDKRYAIVIKEDSITRHALDNSSPPADFLRLTGERISNYHKDNPKWLAGATAAELDCNGDGRTDILISTPSGPLLLINRGFGAFFINADLGKVLKTADDKPLLDGKNLWTALDIDGDGLDDLLIVSPTGAVTAVMNPKPEKKP